MKGQRQEKIVEIIKNSDIETQHQLIDALSQAGFASTQATVSRDIKELRLVKELTQRGRYRYALTEKSAVTNHAERLRTIMRESVVSIACAQNIVVIKTIPGTASGVCFAIDAMNIEDLAGTLAGDDTAFLAMKDNEAALKFSKTLESML